MTGGKPTTLIDGETFITRFLQHVLPPGFKRIRHFGRLSAATKTERLAKAREALAMPAANAQAREDAAAFIKRVAGVEVACCPHCRLGHWQTIEGRRPRTAAMAMRLNAEVRREASQGRPVARLVRRS